MTTQTTAKEVARTIVHELAPDELDYFDAAWEDFQIDPEIPPAAATKSETAEGIDAALVHEGITLIVIPLVVELLKEGAKPLVQDVIRRLRQKRGGPRENDKEIAETIAKNVDGTPSKDD
jgi:hypothetical protein